MTSLKVRWFALAIGAAVAAISVLVGVVATVLARREGVPTILLPLMLLPSFVLLLIHVRRVERGEIDETPTSARLMAWLTPLVTAVIVAGLVAVDVSWLVRL